MSATPMTVAEITAQLLEDYNEAERTNTAEICDRRWIFRGSMSAALNAHKGDCAAHVDLYESRAHRGLWFAWEIEAPSGPDAGWKTSGTFEDVIDEVRDYMVDEVFRADAPRLALARARQVERRRQAAGTGVHP